MHNESCCTTVIRASARHSAGSYLLHLHASPASWLLFSYCPSCTHGFCVYHHRKCCSVKQLLPSDVPSLSQDSNAPKELVPLFTVWLSVFSTLVWCRISGSMHSAFVGLLPSSKPQAPLAFLYFASHYFTVPKSLPWKLSRFPWDPVPPSVVPAAISAPLTLLCLLLSAVTTLGSFIWLPPDNEISITNYSFVLGWLNKWLRNYRH